MYSSCVVKISAFSLVLRTREKYWFFSPHSMKYTWYSPEKSKYPLYIIGMQDRTGNVN